MSKVEKEKKFEENIQELETIINELESGEVDLDTSIEKYTKAMKLVSLCDNKLKNVEEQVNKILTENNTLEDFVVSEQSGDLMKKKKKRRQLNSKGKLLIFIIIVIILIIIIKPKKHKEVNKDIDINNNVTDKVIHNNSDYNLRDGEEIIGTSSNGFLITKLNDVYYVDGVLIVNKTYGLPSSYKPASPYKAITKDYLYGGDYIEDFVMEKYLEMKSDALKEDIKLTITSGYRSYSVQEELYDNYVKRDGKEEADTYSARAGHSEHQSGLCFDLNGTNRDFIKTKEGKWLNDNCYKYGFALRFPEGKEEYTGYMYE